MWLDTVNAALQKHQMDIFMSVRQGNILTVTNIPFTIVPWKYKGITTKTIVENVQDLYITYFMSYCCHTLQTLLKGWHIEIDEMLCSTLL